MTIEELYKQEEENKRKIIERNNLLQEKDWFIVLDANKLYDQPGKVIFRISELSKDLEMFDELKYKGSCEFIYRTNKWKENLKEID